MFTAVSLRTPALRPMFTPRSGGLVETKVKAENGARLSTPAADWVVIHAIGRGTTTPVNNL